MDRKTLEMLIGPSGIVDVFVAMEKKTLSAPFISHEEYLEKVKDCKRILLEFMVGFTFILKHGENKAAEQELVNRHKSLLKNVSDFYEAMTFLIDGYIDYAEYSDQTEFLKTLQEPGDFSPAASNDNDIAILNEMYNPSIVNISGFVEDGDYTIKLEFEDQLSFGVFDGKKPISVNAEGQPRSASGLFFFSRLCIMLWAAEAFADAFYDENYPGDDEETFLKRGILLSCPDYEYIGEFAESYFEKY